MDKIQRVGGVQGSNHQGRCTWTTVDFEASGLSQDSYPIEVGFCLPSGSMYSMLINPLSVDDWSHWDRNAENIHHLSRRMLEQQGESVADVCQFLNHSLGGYDVVLCDSQWDLYWLGRLYRAAHMRPSYCLTEISQWLKRVGTNNADDYYALYYSLGPVRHRAADDAAQMSQAISLLLDS
ncbi:hypothetical protein [Thaumasiovibrio sp. DFM-14]|uniref:hypothetical protein n=1 Tax=Thaumasiovibrio sp. DFM-14 TaxID=3384792 RepID=UPI0039A2E07D